MHSVCGRCMDAVLSIYIRPLENFPLYGMSACASYASHRVHALCEAYDAHADIPYSGKFSRGPIFVERRSSKISRFNFCKIAVPGLLHPRYLVDSASYRMHAQARPSQDVCE